MKISVSILLVLFCSHYATAQINTTSYSDNNDQSLGNKNVFIGVFTDTGGNQVQNSVHLGFSAGSNSTTTNSTMVGFAAGSSSIGNGNLFFGTRAGATSTNTSFNTAIGDNAGEGMTGGSGNLMLGASSGYESDGSNNIYVGVRSGWRNSGDHNIFLGQYAGLNNSTGSNNLYLGQEAGRNTINGTGNVFIGSNSGRNVATAHNKLYIDNSIATTPLIYGDFANNKVGINTTSLVNSVGGQSISNYSLYVTGGILSDEVRVRTTWADYVFTEEYQLKSIPDLAEFIYQNGHLPNCPSEAQVLEQGIEVGTITKIQQEKIEELTLYIIQQNETQQLQRNELQLLRKELNELKDFVLKKGNKSLK